MKKLISLLFIFLLANQLFAQLNFKAESKKIILGDSVKLSWKIEKIRKMTTVRIKNLKEDLPLVGTIFVKPNKSKSYYLEVFTSKKDKKYKKAVRITVIQPQISVFKTKNLNNNDRDSTEIIWETQNTEYIVINDTITHLPLNGNIKLLLDSTKTIKLKAYNKNGKYADKQIVVNIKNVEYIKGAENIFLNDTAIINWQFKYCKYVKIIGTSKQFKPKDHIKLQFKKDTTFHFFVYKENGDTIKKSYHINVNSPLIKFLVPQMVYKGMAAYLIWEVKPGFSVKITGTGKTITKLKGKIKIPLDEEKRYTLSIKDDAGQLVYKGTKKIQDIKSLIKKFKVPEVAIAGSPTKIYWEVLNGFTARIEGVKSKLPHKGKIEIIPIESRNYTLVVLRKGKEIDRKELPMEVVQRRSFVKQVKDFSELSKTDELNFEIFAIDESNYPKEVKLYVLAVDGEGNFVKGLEHENKTRQKKIIKRLVEKSGKTKRKVTGFTFREYEDAVSLPYDISMALDYSGSMYGTINELEKAVQTFITNKNSDDRVAIARFDHSLVKVNDLENNTDSLIKTFTTKGLDTLGGGTALYSGSDFAMDLTDSSQNNKILIIFTDGMENSSFQYFGKYAYSATDLAKKARKEGVTVHVIAYGSGVNNSILRKLAYTTGGNFYKLKTASDINAVFKELPIIFRNYYLITYRPTKQKGKHSIRIIYDNLQDEDVTIQSDYQVGEKFIIDEKQPGYAKTYWEKAADSLNMSPVSVPQAIAYFDFDKDELLDTYKKSIDTYIDYLNIMKSSSVIIFGHTDSKGSDKYCYELSERRANTIKDYMIENGIDSEKIFIKPCGKTKMIWTPEDREWKARENRRIEILLLK